VESPANYRFRCGEQFLAATGPQQGCAGLVRTVPEVTSAARRVIAEEDDGGRDTAAMFLNLRIGEFAADPL